MSTRLGARATREPRARTGWRALAAVLAALARGAGTADELARATGLSAGDLATALTLLELAGRITGEEGVVRSTIAR